MGKTDYAGIDYSLGNPNVNRDSDTGIHYGIISLDSLGGYALEAFEPQYTPYCPHCGSELPEDFDPLSTVECNRCAGSGYRVDTSQSCHCDVCQGYGEVLPTCPSCDKTIDDGEQWPEEPDYWTYEEDGHKLCLDSDNDVWVFKSPYVTNAQYCSPCAPGAGYLDNPCTNGPRTYALGPDWFDEENPMAYEIHRIDTDID